MRKKPYKRPTCPPLSFLVGSALKIVLKLQKSANHESSLKEDTRMISTTDFRFRFEDKKWE